MRIHQLSIFVDDQSKALAFYTDVLGFQRKHDIPMGEFRWVTVVSAENPGGTELVLEPDTHPAVQAYKTGLAADGYPLASFAVDDLHAEFTRLRDLDVRFTQEPMDIDKSIIATFDDTCGNLIQLVQLK